MRLYRVFPTLQLSRCCFASSATPRPGSRNGVRRGRARALPAVPSSGRVDFGWKRDRNNTQLATTPATSGIIGTSGEEDSALAAPPVGPPVSRPWAYLLPTTGVADGRVGSVPAGSTSRLIVLVCPGRPARETTNDQQPGVGTST